jgi:dTDP-4-dehydrorhamnose 3,5-epimerase
MNVTPTAIPDVVMIEPRVYGDRRGFFLETWNSGRFAAAGIDADFVQDNHSFSRQGTLRGLHYQIERPQGKLVWVVSGKIFDVAVDLRQNSKTFGKWVAAWLSRDNHRMLWIPSGFAHGFYVASESTDFFYKCTDFYAPESERTIRWNDPDLAIDWPLVNGAPPTLSEKDRNGERFREAEYYH